MRRWGLSGCSSPSVAQYSSLVGMLTSGTRGGDLASLTPGNQVRASGSKPPSSTPYPLGYRLSDVVVPTIQRSSPRD